MTLQQKTVKITKKIRQRLLANACPGYALTPEAVGGKAQGSATGPSVLNIDALQADVAPRWMIGRGAVMVIGEMLFQRVGLNFTEFLLEQPKNRDRAYGPGW